MNLDATADGNETKHIVAIDGIAATCQLIVNTFQVLVNDEDVVVQLRTIGRERRVVQDKLFCRACLSVARNAFVALLQFNVLIQDHRHIERVLCYVAIEVAGLLVAQLLHCSHHHRFVKLYLAVLELAFKHLLHHECLFLLGLLDSQTNLGPGTRGLDNRKPLLFGTLGGGGHDFDLVTRLQLLTETAHLIIYTGTGTGISYLGVDVVGHVEHGGTLGELQEVAFWRKDEDLVIVKVHLELVHSLQTTTAFQHQANTIEPVVHAALGLSHTLVAPVGCHAAFCNLVHALCSYLNLHPFAFRPQHGDVKTLVAVALWYGEPVAHALGVRHVHIGDEGKGLPAYLLLLLQRTVDDDANGEQVVNAFEVAFLFLHLLPDGMDGFGTTLHVEFDASIGKLLLDRCDEAFNISIACLFGSVELLLDQVVGIVLHVL